MYKEAIASLKKAQKLGILVFCMLFASDPRLFQKAGDLLNGDIFNHLFSSRAIALKPSVCPENLETLVEQMLPDLPGYANRVLRRSPVWKQSDVKIYVITAGNPEFEPLPLGPGRSSTSSLDRGSNQEANTLPSLNGDDDDPQQVFITTLERQYRGTQVIEIPRYYWLFMTQTAEGWRLALIFSRIGSNRANEPLTPPEESSQSFIAEAIRLWLRDLWLKDCRDRQNS